ncbi:hypothetical protein PLICRDRAFT_65918, partial [Plicaturopsis crispa FD-325 SS-3]
ELAGLLKCNRDTLRLFMKRNGIERKYTAMSNADLDVLVKAFKTRKPESGMRYMIGSLRRQGHRVQRR